MKTKFYESPALKRTPIWMALLLCVSVDASVMNLEHSASQDHVEEFTDEGFYIW